MMIKYTKTVIILLFFLIIGQLISSTFDQSLRAFEFHRITYKSCSGIFPYINQIEDTKPYGMDGSIASAPAACIMISAYYGSINKKVDDLGPSGYGYYVCNPYELKGHTFSEMSNDPAGKSFAGAYGFLIKEGLNNPSPEIVSDFLRAHGIATTYYKQSGTPEETMTILKKEIINNHPVFMQIKERNLVITGFGVSLDQKDILLIKDPANPKLKFVYLSQVDPILFLLTRSLSYDDNVKVVCSEIEVLEKPSSNSKIIDKKQKDSTGTIKLGPKFSDLWINEKINETLISWFYIQWDDGSKGFTSLGKGCVNHFDPYIKIIEDPEKDKVTLTLTIHEEKVEGIIVKDALIQAVDGKGKIIKQSTNQLGYAILKGEKGNWSFTISKKDYFDKVWTENIEQSDEKHVFILKKPKSEEEMKRPDLICKEIRLSGGIAVEGKQFYINPMVQNIGKSVVDSRSHVKVLLSPKKDTNITDDILLGIAEVSTLKLEEKCIATVFFYQFPSIPGSAQRDFSMWPVIIVDSENEVEESDENNIFEATSPIIIKRKPRDRDKGSDSPCEIAPVDKPILISPVSDTANPVTFSWQAVDCASFYFLSILRDDGSLYVGEGPISGTTYTTPFFLEINKYYKWTVTPCNQWGCGPISDKARFFITR